ncbi:MAG: DUF559 domain-containing protein [Nocardioides sp.]|nr:DUF559 domain-containing protein [Nocardioides sp.]
MDGTVFPSTPFTAATAPCTRARLRKAIQSREIIRPIRGGYLRADVELTEIARAQVAALVMGPTAVLCDRTAAWVLGVDCMAYAELDGPPQLESCVLRGHEPTERPEVAGRTRDLREEDIVIIGGVRVTSPLRTAADLLCLLPRRQALAAADALMRVHGFSLAELRRLLVRYYRRRGVVQARNLAPLVDGRSESAGESWTRVEIIDHGLTIPQPQFWISVDGVPTYRLDLAYPHARIAIEYDGVAHHTSPADRRRDEGRRAWLRAHGWRVIVLTKDSFSDEAIAMWIGELRAMLASD